jgi:hypothetical protein
MLNNYTISNLFGLTVKNVEVNGHNVTLKFAGGRKLTMYHKQQKAEVVSLSIQGNLSSLINQQLVDLRSKVVCEEDTTTVVTFITEDQEFTVEWFIGSEIIYAEGIIFQVD